MTRSRVLPADSSVLGLVGTVGFVALLLTVLGAGVVLAVPGPPGRRGRRVSVAVARPPGDWPHGGGDDPRPRVSGS